MTVKTSSSQANFLERQEVRQHPPQSTITASCEVSTLQRDINVNITSSVKYYHYFLPASTKPVDVNIEVKLLLLTVKYKQNLP